ncbi:MAG: hypothetical protein DRP01_00415 [Archaeoglobales archaeon]|nr:MAG: hypothetical protein DRP01_00415 [Archaeoglobales archaeon]
MKSAREYYVQLFFPMTDWKRFVAGYDLYRIYDIDVKLIENKKLIKGVVRYYDRREDKIKSHQVLIDLVEPETSVCSCEDNKYRPDRFCKHMIAVLLSSLEKGLISEDVIRNMKSILKSELHRKDWIKDGKLRFTSLPEDYRGDGIL